MFKSNSFGLRESVTISDKNMCRTDVDFQEFCLQVLFECVSKDRPALLQVLYYFATMS